MIWMTKFSQRYNQSILSCLNLIRTLFGVLRSVDILLFAFSCWCDYALWRIRCIEVWILDLVLGCTSWYINSAARSINISPESEEKRTPSSVWSRNEGYVLGRYLWRLLDAHKSHRSRCCYLLWRKERLAPVLVKRSSRLSARGLREEGRN